MDSKASLDYALFQLTPTRTRCDLVLFSGKKSEKVASGLVEPFVAHLKYAKDQIPKGGYSITLRPPDYSPWFTKATFLRFVRFVSTPEILERITRIEREILQIDDSSIQPSEIPCLEETTRPGEESSVVDDGNTKKGANSSKSTAEEDHGGPPIENSRVRLRRLMDSRKALLQKEQAMAYARAVVAGYEIDTIDDLICFADAFGASRLREACIDFKELYKKKHSDNQWMDELAAVQASVTDLSYMATSGIMLAGENIIGDGTLSDSISPTTTSDRTNENNFSPAPKQTPNVQQQVPWANPLPPYMYNFQGPMQQVPAYYPYYPGNMGWSPPGAAVPSKNHKPSKKKEKYHKSNGTTDASEEEDEEQTASSESDVEKEHYDNKKHGSSGKKRHSKKSNRTADSKTVVIRNINYITSKRHDGEENRISGESSDEDEDYSIREGVDNAIASLERHTRRNRGKQSRAEQDEKKEVGSNVSEGGNGNSGWDAFQNLLLSNEVSDSSELPKNHIGDDEHFVMRNFNGGISSKTGDTIDFSNGENFHPTTKKTALDGENALFAEPINGLKTSSGVGVTTDFSREEQVTIRTRKEEDWFIVNNNSSGNSEIQDGKKLDFDNGPHETTGFGQKKTTKDATVDYDSFMLESRSTVDENHISRWTTDISIDADIDMPKPEKGSPTISTSAEPDELCMMLVRESRESNASWKPEMDYEMEISFSEADKKSSMIKTNGHAVKDPVVNGKNDNGKKNAGPTTKRIGRDVSRTLSGTLSRNKLDSVTKNKKVVSPAIAQKTKLMKEEEDRKRMEEAAIQRQKRIAERTAAAGKKLVVGNKSTLQKPDKNRSPGVIQKISQAKLSA